MLFSSHYVIVSISFSMYLLLGFVALLRQLVLEAVVTMVVRKAKREVCCVGWSSGGVRGRDASSPGECI